MKLNIRLQIDKSLVLVEVLGQFKFMGLDLFVHEVYGQKKLYTVSEFETGFAVGQIYFTEKEAIEQAKIMLEGKETELQTILAETIKEFGIANEPQEPFLRRGYENR